MRDGLFHGIVPMQVTPFHNDGSIDLESRAAPSNGRPDWR
jgi:dihydrodipicolinate synthase/N-acetylneuraminate lyase